MGIENKLAALGQKWHMTSLEKIFIEKEIYEVIKKAQNKDEMIALIEEGLKPFVKKKLRKEVTREEILKLAEIPIRRISRFDRKKADEALRVTLTEAGVELNEIENPEAFRALTQPVYDKWGKRFPELVEQIVKGAGQE